MAASKTLYYLLLLARDENLRKAIGLLCEFLIEEMLGSTGTPREKKINHRSAMP
jgi:hypothetical protein